MDTWTRACEAPRPSEDARPAFRAETHSGLHRAPRLLRILMPRVQALGGVRRVDILPPRTLVLWAGGAQP